MTECNQVLVGVLGDEFLVFLELVDTHRGQFLMQLQLSLGQLSQIDHHQKVLAEEKKSLGIGWIGYGIKKGLILLRTFMLELVIFSNSSGVILGTE